MSASLSNLEFMLFKKYIKDKCGIDITDDKVYLIETRLSSFLAEYGLHSFDELYNLLSSKNDPVIAEKVIDAITTNETLWFRDKTPWTILEEIYLPQYIKQLREFKKNKIRIWSSAASTGQEAYSTAICIQNYLERNNINDIKLNNFEIIATDISKTVLEIAKRGRYDAISIMRGLDSNLKDKYFTKNGNVFELNEKIKNAVTFQQFNLQNRFLVLGNFEVVFLRYVLIYFADDLKDEVLNKIYGQLDKEGVFFIGSSELYSLTNKYFEMCHYNTGTYYRKLVNL